MTRTSDPETRLGDLFVSVTGRSTVTESQRNDRPVRLAARRTEAGVSDYVAMTARADGLDDAIDDVDLG